MKLREKIDSFLEKALILIMSLMVVNVLWQVFSRYLLTNPSSFTDELARYLMIWVGVLGAAYVSGKRSHVAITYFAEKLNEVRKRKLQIIIDLLILSFSFFGFILGGFRLVYITSILEQYSPSLHIPLAVVYLVIPLSGLLIIYYKISDLIQLRND